MRGGGGGGGGGGESNGHSRQLENATALDSRLYILYINICIKTVFHMFITCTYQMG